MIDTNHFMGYHFLTTLTQTEKGVTEMDLNYFKDKLFDLLNDSDVMDISDIVTDDRRGLFTVSTMDGSTFELLCRKL